MARSKSARAARRDPRHLGRDGGLRVAQLALDRGHVGMALAELRREVGVPPLDLGELGPQRHHGLRLHGLGERTRVAAVQALDLLDLGARLGGARPRHAELVVQLRQLLLADEAAAGADDVVLGPELLDPVLGVADAGAQLLETGGERLAGAAGGFRLRRRAFLHVGVHERVGQAGRFLRVPGHDRDVDDEAALGAANGDALVEIVQHGNAQVRRAPLAAEEVGDERLQGGDRRPAPRGEFGIALEAFAVDQKVEHLRRLEHPHLALDERHVGVRDSGRAG